MKVEFKDNKIIVYIYNQNLELDNLDVLGEKLKELFKTLIKNYNQELNGLYSVEIFENKTYGYILEIQQMCHYSFSKDIIDLQIRINKNTIFLMEFDDIVDFSLDLICFNNKYFLNINEISQLIKYIEHGKIKYSDCQEIIRFGVNLTH